jgi:hypothetical protein
MMIHSVYANLVEKNVKDVKIDLICVYLVTWMGKFISFKEQHAILIIVIQAALIVSDRQVRTVYFVTQVSCLASDISVSNARIKIAYHAQIVYHFVKYVFQAIVLKKMANVK